MNYQNRIVVYHRLTKRKENFNIIKCTSFLLIISFVSTSTTITYIIKCPLLRMTLYLKDYDQILNNFVLN